jgi:hypothetical protein
MSRERVRLKIVAAQKGKYLVTRYPVTAVSHLLAGSSEVLTSYG